MVNNTLVAVGLFGSATASSYVFFSNLGMSQYGLVPYLQGKVANVKLSGSDAVKTWQGYYDNGKFYSLSGAILNMVCGILVATTHPAVGIQRLGFGSAVFSLTMIPYTLAFIMPTNKEIMSLNDKAEKGESVDSAQVSELISRWVPLHSMRYVSYVGAWLCSIAALALNGNVIIDVVDVVYNVTPVA